MTAYFPNLSAAEMKQSEDNLQIACVNWFRYQYQQHLIYHSPNGGKRNAREAVKFRQMGVVSGVPDLFIAVARKGYHGLYIELKIGKNKPTENQQEVMSKLIKAGYKCNVVHSIDEFMKTVNDYLL